MQVNLGAHAESVVQHMVMTHQSVVGFSSRFAEQLRRNVYVTPKNYLDFIKNYHTSLEANRMLLGDMAARLNGGLAKLIQAADEVDKMQVTLGLDTNIRPSEKMTK